MSEQVQPSGVNAAMDAMPAWMKSLMLFGNTFGVTALILAYYLAQDAGFIGNPVAEKLEEMRGGQIIHEATTREIVSVIEDLAKQAGHDAKTQRLRCVMRAQTDDEKRACLNRGKD